MIHNPLTHVIPPQRSGNCLCNRRGVLCLELRCHHHPPTTNPGGTVTMSATDESIPAPSSPEISSSETDAAIVGGVVAAVVVVVVVLVIILLRYLYRHKGTYRTNEDKGSEFAENSDTALKNDPSLQESVDESKKEYFI
ncbi:glycophorin-C [Rhinoderma darwinii]|uniref:glycophorin-C n=1 Tax=Rhinoderma darwinii TaxID=43563 RepID=UPI003F665F21